MGVRFDATSLSREQCMATIVVRETILIQNHNVGQYINIRSKTNAEKCKVL